MNYGLWYMGADFLYMIFVIEFILFFYAFYGVIVKQRKSYGFLRLSIEYFIIIKKRYSDYPAANAIAAYVMSHVKN